MSAPVGTGEPTAAEVREVTLAQLAGAVLWPSFVAAGLATTLVFAVFDPLELDAASGPVIHTRLGGYSAGFALFWFVCALSSAASVWFAQPTEAPRPPERPEA